MLCHRLVHLRADGGVASVTTVEAVMALAPDAAGGMWYGSTGVIGHVDAAGDVTYAQKLDEDVRGVAVAPDGAAWLALARCALRG